MSTYSRDELHNLLQKCKYTLVKYATFKNSSSKCIQINKNYKKINLKLPSTVLNMLQHNILALEELRKRFEDGFYDYSCYIENIYINNFIESKYIHIKTISTYI